MKRASDTPGNPKAAPARAAAIAILTVLLGAVGCQTPKDPGPIHDDEEILQIRPRGSVPLRLAVLAPSMEQDAIDPEEDDFAAIRYESLLLRDKLVDEIGGEGPFDRVLAIDAEQITEYQRPTFNPAELPADLYLEIRLKRYLVEDDGHNGAFVPNLLFFLWNPLFIYPVSFYVADESFVATISAEVLLISMYSNLPVTQHLKYKKLRFETDLDEWNDSTWDLVSDMVEEQMWRVFMRELLRDLHGDFIAATQADNWPDTLGKIERMRQWEALQQREAEAVHYAYILGVGTYLRQQAISGLDYVEADARALAQHLADKTAADLRPYIGRTAGSAASTDFDSGALKTLREITEKATPRDAIFLYLAGKGAVVRTEAGTSSYFLLYDSDLKPDKIAQTSLPMKTLFSLLEQTKAREVVVVMDIRDIEYREAVQAGGAAAGGDGIAGFYDGILPPGGGKVLLASAKPGQRGHDSSVVERGGFGYYLLEGVRGPADANGDEVVTVAEIYEYLKPRLDKLARLNGYTQEPLVLGEASVPLLPR